MQVVKIHPRGNSLGITIPHAYLRELRWGTGELLILERKGDRLEARALRGSPEATATAHPETLEAGDGGA